MIFLKNPCCVLDTVLESSCVRSLMLITTFSFLVRGEGLLALSPYVVMGQIRVGQTERSLTLSPLYVIRGPALGTGPIWLFLGQSPGPCWGCAVSHCQKGRASNGPPTMGYVIPEALSIPLPRSPEVTGHHRPSPIYERVNANTLDIKFCCFF